MKHRNEERHFAIQKTLGWPLPASEAPGARMWGGGLASGVGGGQGGGGGQYWTPRDKRLVLDPAGGVASTGARGMRGRGGCSVASGPAPLPRCLPASAASRDPVLTAWS